MPWVASGLVGLGLFVGLSWVATDDMLVWGLLAGVVFLVGGLNWGDARWWRRHLWWSLLLVAAAFAYALAR